MNLNNTSPFSEYYFKNEFNYVNIKNRENFLKSAKVCKNCFCFIPLKIFFKGASCPIGKWSPIEEKNE